MDEQPQRKPCRKKAGRPPKQGGPRAELHAAVPEPLADLLKRDAVAQQMPMGDLLAEILAAHYTRPEAMPQAI